LSALRQVAAARLRAWARRRHGPDRLPATVQRRRVYILPTRYGMMLSVILLAMLLAGLNYNSNLALGFGFLIVSLTLVTMHHCNRNLLGLSVDVATETDAIAGRDATLEFMLRNDAAIDRCDIEVRCLGAAGSGTVTARDAAAITVVVPVTQRGVLTATQFELRTLYPFGWFYAWTYVHSTLTVYVAPQPAGDRILPAAGAQGASFPADTPGDEDFSGLRAYQPGIALKHMAWKVLARGGEAAVRTYSSLAAQPEWFEWDVLAGLDTESRLAQLAQWIMASERAQHTYGLRLPGIEIAPSGGAAHRIACLRALAQFGSAA
jgi:uncharacterized protein (DUF58 family)